MINQRKITALSQWVTSSYPKEVQADDEKVLWRRCAKVNEEAGEVTEAILGYLGENPRKGHTHDRDDVIEELLDTALAALGAVEQLTGNQGLSVVMFDNKIEKVYRRAGLG